MGGIKFSNLEGQFEALEEQLARALARSFSDRMPELLNGWADDLEQAHLDRLERQVDPDGARWSSIAPMTKDLRQATGSAEGDRLGGPKLRDSLKKGKRGNVRKVKRLELTYGSHLSKKGYKVVETFQTTFTMPKRGNLGGTTERRAVKLEQGPLTAEDQQHLQDAGSKIRGYMFRMVGIRAPRRGGFLTHPGRQIVGINTGDLKRMENRAVVFVNEVIDDAIPKAQEAVRLALSA